MQRVRAGPGPGAYCLPAFPLSSSIMLIWLLLVTAVPRFYCSSQALSHSDGYNLTWTNLPNSSPSHFFHAKDKAGRFSNRPCDFSAKRLPPKGCCCWGNQQARSSVVKIHSLCGLYHVRMAWLCPILVSAAPGPDTIHGKLFTGIKSSPARPMIHS